MSAKFNTIAIIGATSGLGEGLTRRYHASGKKIIALGRNVTKLQALAHELPGLETQPMDVNDISTLPAQIDTLLSAHPDIDAVVAMAGIQKHFSIVDPSTSSVESIQEEITTNITFPTVLAREMVPFFLKKAPKPTTLMLVSSGLAFVPIPFYPVYCPTKAAIHSLSITLRAQLADTNIRIVELAPPYVATNLDNEHRDHIRARFPEARAIEPMGLGEWLDKSLAGLEQENKLEVGVGFSDMGITKWREAFGGVLQMRGIKG